MAKGMTYSDVYAMYRLCNGEKELREFCTECGVDYNHFMQWQRKQLWNDKLGKSVEIKEPVMSAVTITGLPEESKKPDSESRPINSTKAPISFILIKLSDGMSLRKYNTNPEEVSSLLSKLVG